MDHTYQNITSSPDIWVNSAPIAIPNRFMSINERLATSTDCPVFDLIAKSSIILNGQIFNIYKHSYLD